MSNIKVSNLLQNEPNLVCQLVRTARLQITTDALNNIADNFQIPEENARNIIAELEKINITEPWKKALIGEKLCFKVFFDGVISGKYGYDDFNNLTGGPRLAYYISKIFIKKSYCEYIRVLAAYSDVCDKPYYLSKGKEIKKIKTDCNNIPRYYVLARWLTPYFGAILANNAEFQTKLAISKIKLALNIYKGKHAAFPENLEQLKPDILREIPIDELTGTPLTYKREVEKYVLFSAAVRKLEEEREQEREVARKKDSKK
jgi:hypothetical protein